MKIWIVGKVHEERYMSQAWEFFGAFEKESAAQALALKCDKEDTEAVLNHFFIAPAMLNEPLPKEAVIWPGAYYPADREGEITAKDIIGMAERLWGRCPECNHLLVGDE